MATRDPLADLKQLGQQYWQGLQDLGQQFLRHNPAPSAPWSEGMDKWRALYQGADSAGVLGNLLDQGKTWMNTLEQVFKSAGSADLGTLARQSLEQFRSSQPWLGGLGNNSTWFDPAQLQQWLSSTGMGMQPGAAHAPAFGFNREQQERLTQLGDDLAAYQQETQRYQALINKAMEAAIARMEHKLAQLDEPGRHLKSLKSVYDLWVDALEESYAEVALSPEFREAYGALVNSQMRVRKGVQTQVERNCAELGMPTRSELDGVHRKVADLRRSVRQVSAEEVQGLRAELDELRQQLATLQAGRTSEVPAAAAAAPAPSRPARTSKTASTAASKATASRRKRSTP